MAKQKKTFIEAESVDIQNVEHLTSSYIGGQAHSLIICTVNLQIRWVHPNKYQVCLNVEKMLRLFACMCQMRLRLALAAFLTFAQRVYSVYIFLAMPTET
jgi:hypothetical protein